MSTEPRHSDYYELTPHEAPEFLTFTDAGVAKLLEAGLSSATLKILSGKNIGKWTGGVVGGTDIGEQYLAV